jgi:hypothetical protein
MSRQAQHLPRISQLQWLLSLEQIGQKDQDRRAHQIPPSERHLNRLHQLDSKCRRRYCVINNIVRSRKNIEKMVRICIYLP